MNIERSKCPDCVHSGLREMIKQPYGYGGDIPCLRCSGYVAVEDLFESKPKRPVSVADACDILWDECVKNKAQKIGEWDCSVKTVDGVRKYKVRIELAEINEGEGK